MFPTLCVMTISTVSFGAYNTCGAVFRAKRRSRIMIGILVLELQSRRCLKVNHPESRHQRVLFFTSLSRHLSSIRRNKVFSRKQDKMMRNRNPLTLRLGIRMTAPRRGTDKKKTPGIPNTIITYCLPYISCVCVGFVAHETREYHYDFRS